MLRTRFTFILLAGLAQTAAAQTPLYQPRDIKAAFAKDASPDYLTSGVNLLSTPTAAKPPCTSRPPSGRPTKSKP